MKKASLVIFILTFICVSASSQPESRRTKYSASVSVNSNGIASIPAFSLGKPATIASLSVSRGRFSYDPLLAYGFNMKPWFIDNWLHYRIIDRPRFVLRTGWNFSSFFTEHKLENGTSLTGERYFAGELAGILKFNSKTSLSLMYWSDNGIEPGSISGHYFTSIGEITDIALGESILLGSAMQLFYISYDGNNDGLFVSPKVTFGIRDFPISVIFQATQVIFSNIEPNPGFEWNAGLNYIF